MSGFGVLEGTRAVVTGAGGVGRGIALGLAGRGAAVGVLDVDERSAVCPVSSRRR